MDFLHTECTRSAKQKPSTVQHYGSRSVRIWQRVPLQSDVFIYTLARRKSPCWCGVASGDRHSRPSSPSKRATRLVDAKMVACLAVLLLGTTTRTCLMRDRRSDHGRRHDDESQRPLSHFRLARTSNRRGILKHRSVPRAHALMRSPGSSIENHAQRSSGFALQSALSSRVLDGLSHRYRCDRSQPYYDGMRCSVRLWRFLI